MTTRAGTIRVNEFGRIRVHSYISPEDGLFVHTTIVEGATKLVVFDAQFFLPYAEEVADYMAGLSKPVERIVISHVHPDHWSGLQVLTRRLANVPIYALAAVRDYIAANGQKIMTSRRTAFGEKVASSPMVPDSVLAEGRETIDGVTYEFERHDDGESAHQLVARLPEQRLLAVFDLVFPKHVHMFTVAPNFDHWIAILEYLRGLDGYDHILVGHSEPADKSDINANIDYLRQAKAIHASSSTPDQYAGRIKAAFPQCQQPGWIDFSALLLYGVINP